MVVPASLGWGVGSWQPRQALAVAAGAINATFFFTHHAWLAMDPCMVIRIQYHMNMGAPGPNDQVTNCK